MTATQRFASTILYNLVCNKIMCGGMRKDVVSASLLNYASGF
jgi:hypothetical protein